MLRQHLIDLPNALEVVDQVLAEEKIDYNFRALMLIKDSAGREFLISGRHTNTELGLATGDSSQKYLICQIVGGVVVGAGAYNLSKKDYQELSTVYHSQYRHKSTFEVVGIIMKRLDIRLKAMNDDVLPKVTSSSIETQLNRVNELVTQERKETANLEGQIKDLQEKLKVLNKKLDNNHTHIQQLWDESKRLNQRKTELQHLEYQEMGRRFQLHTMTTPRAELKEPPMMSYAPQTSSVPPADPSFYQSNTPGLMFGGSSHRPSGPLRSYAESQSESSISPYNPYSGPL